MVLNIFFSMVDLKNIFIKFKLLSKYFIEISIVLNRKQ